MSLEGYGQSHDPRTESGDRATLAAATYFAVLRKVPPAGVEHIDNALDLCDLIHKEATGFSLSKEAKIALGVELMQMRRDGRLLSPVVLKFIRVTGPVLRNLHHLLLLVATFAIYREGSSYVVMVAAVGQWIELPFGRWLQERGHPSSRLHGLLGIVLALISLVASLLHAFSEYLIP